MRAVREVWCTRSCSSSCRRVALWALHAIAVGWDTRRIGYGNEGKHPYELEVAAILGMHAGHATEYVAAAIDQAIAHDAVIAADPMYRAPNTPIGKLVVELGLSDRAIDVLLVIAAGSLWGEIARLYGILANDTSHATVTELVVQQVLAGRHDRHDVSAELDPSAPLIRLGLVHGTSRHARPFAELEAEPVVFDLLRGNPVQLGDGDDGADGIAAVRSARPPAGRVDRRRSRSSHGQRDRIVVSGRPGSGRKTLLAALAAKAGRELARDRCARAAADGRSVCRRAASGAPVCASRGPRAVYRASRRGDVRRTRRAGRRGRVATPASWMCRVRREPRCSDAGRCGACRDRARSVVGDRAA